MVKNVKTKASVMASSEAVAAGSAAPAATRQFDDGSSLPLASFADRQQVLYFYPRDDTPGCGRL